MNWRATIGWYEILSAGAGILLMGYAAVHHAQLPGRSFEAALGPFLALGIAGWRLARRSHGDRWLSVMMQLLQVPFFDLRGVAWKFAAGLHASVAIIKDRLELWAGFDTTLLTGWQATGRPLVLGINLVPIVVVVMIARLPKAAITSPPLATSRAA